MMTSGTFRWEFTQLERDSERLDLTQKVASLLFILHSLCLHSLNNCSLLRSVRSITTSMATEINNQYYRQKIYIL